ncbi:hypothetical protein C0995_001755 [Termitomyces sp. Mi166|nr:hypothetical protein C0995_001755 [Termitomyces sp. Mi166\
MLPMHAGPASQMVATLPAGNPPKRAKKKGKGKVKDPKPSVTADKEVASLFQHLYNAGVPKKVHDELLDSQLVQLVFIQLLDELDTTRQQRDKAWAALFQQASEKSKRAVTPPTALGPKKACYQAPSPCLEAPQPFTRAPALPYSEKEMP